MITIIRNNESDETVQLKQMNELDTKLNLLINNLNKQNSNENANVNKGKETNNVYDIILFVIFSLFILLLESLTKLISKI